PATATNLSRWQIKLGYHIFNYTENVTIPQSCWDADPDTLMFRLTSNASSTGQINAESTGKCYNGTDWVTVITYTSLSTSSNVVCHADKQVDGVYAFDGDYNFASLYRDDVNQWCLAIVRSGGAANTGKLFEEAMFWRLATNASTSHSFLNNNTLPEGNYSIIATCTDGSTTDETELWFVIDETPPALTTNIINNKMIIVWTVRQIYDRPFTL
ncbi:unnamed protein product, partial [marine sediment metagenome]